ncbi:MAG: ABC transporter ATP-binding protein [Bradyrhizobium sp.]|uniref:nickel ABC transporter ATP-binding protein NikE n=1 Tax=Bradyrhizobium sp. TaxID=376 RepID=UPI001DD07A1E|nr:ABC transporter ATP-binding protein [Bradyrhizobium sp.]MBV9563699.1 ABC transporter ATP-binding protein [Bradyrhizobium sp.]
MTERSPPLLDVEDLAVSFDIHDGRVTAVDGVSLSMMPGETLGIVGESGSGKSVMAYGLVGLLAPNGRIDRGSVRFEGRDIRADRRCAKAVRGRGISFIFQNPRAALNPIRSVGDQVRDVLVTTGRASRADSAGRALELLELVRIARAKERLGAFPHELSGGMCQRVLIATALAAEPKLLIADEPTTGLDVTTQKVIMDTLYELGASKGLATLLITHDVGLAARYCRRIAVMWGGRLVETGSAADVLERSRNAYTQRLVAATPRVGRKLIDLLPPAERAAFLQPEPSRPPPATKNGGPLLEVHGLGKTFEVGRSVKHHAVRDVSLRLDRGARLGIVGESGSGKTTLSRMIARLLDQSAGRITFDGEEIGAVPSASFGPSATRHRIQVVFQDPLGSLNPRFTAFDAILNPLRRFEPSLPADRQRKRVVEAARQAGFDPALLQRFPHQLSGGQQARIGIARALVAQPDLLILDEPTSALDVSVQALVLNQLDLLQRELGLTFILVSHDLNVIRLMCDRVMVMRSGEVIEANDVETIFRAPAHPYTRELIAAIPELPQAIVETMQ